jgi:hypothetical protein
VSVGGAGVLGCWYFVGNEGVWIIFWSCLDSDGIGWGGWITCFRFEEERKVKGSEVRESEEVIRLDR